MRYTVQLSRVAIHVLDRLDRVTERRLRERLHQLAEAPEDPRLSKLLVDSQGIRSARVGDWRILYLVDHATESLWILAIRPRGQAYRNL